MKTYSKNQINTLVSENLIAACNDAADNSNYKFYSMVGFDDTKVRLGVYTGANCDCWSVAVYDDRGLWFDAGDRPDLKKGYKISTSSWRNDFGDVFKDGFDDASDWVRSLINKNLVQKCSI